MSDEKQYVGVLKERHGPHGALIHMALTPVHIAMLVDEFKRKGGKPTTIVNLTITRRVTPSDRGVTHKCVISQLEPENAQDKAVAVLSAETKVHEAAVKMPKAFPGSTQAPTATGVTKGEAIGLIEEMF